MPATHTLPTGDRRTLGERVNVHLRERLMGGEITVESVPGRGSTFRFDVAARPTRATSRSNTRRPPGSPHL